MEMRGVDSTPSSGATNNNTRLDLNAPSMKGSSTKKKESKPVAVPVRTKR